MHLMLVDMYEVVGFEFGAHVGALGGGNHD